MSLFTVINVQLKIKLVMEGVSGVRSKAVTLFSASSGKRRSLRKEEGLQERGGP